MDNFNWQEENVTAYIFVQLRWLLVLYLRAYATILREHAGSTIPTILEGQPTEAYRTVLRDLTVDLAEQVVEFKASRTLEPNRYHRPALTNTRQALYLDSGAGPRYSNTPFYRWLCV